MSERNELPAKLVERAKKMLLALKCHACETQAEYDIDLQIAIKYLADVQREAMERAAQVADRMKQAAGNVLEKAHDGDAAVQYDTASEIAEAIRALADSPAQRAGKAEPR